MTLKGCGQLQIVTFVFICGSTGSLMCVLERHCTFCLPLSNVSPANLPSECAATGLSSFWSAGQTHPHALLRLLFDRAYSRDSAAVFKPIQRRALTARGHCNGSPAVPRLRSLDTFQDGRDSSLFKRPSSPSPNEQNVRQVVTSCVVFVYFFLCENAGRFSEGNAFREQTASLGGHRGL